MKILVEIPERTTSLSRTKARLNWFRAPVSKLVTVAVGADDVGELVVAAELVAVAFDEVALVV